MYTTVRILNVHHVLGLLVHISAKFGEDWSNRQRTRSKNVILVSNCYDSPTLKFFQNAGKYGNYIAFTHFAAHSMRNCLNFHMRPQFYVAIEQFQQNSQLFLGKMFAPFSLKKAPSYCLLFLGKVIAPFSLKKASLNTLSASFQIEFSTNTKKVPKIGPMLNYSKGSISAWTPIPRSLKLTYASDLDSLDIPFNKPNSEDWSKLKTKKFFQGKWSKHFPKKKAGCFCGTAL